MAYSYVLYAGDGSNKYFSFNFSYLDKSHVKAKIDSATTTAFSWLTDSSIQFNTAPAAGVVIEIYRETPQNSAPVDFTDGSILLERDLDLLATFNLYVGQEATDRAARAISVGSDGAFNALGLRVSNAADPVDAQDLVTKKWAETSVSSGVNQAQTAAAEATAAATTAYNAVNYTQADRVATAQYAADAANSKNVAASGKDYAIAAKDQAVSAKDTAVSKATEAATSATSANAAAVTAEAARDTAVAAKTDLVSASNTAVAKATEAENSATSALDSKNTAVASATAASGSANLAQNWASSMVLVDGVSFGAKKYASDAAASATQAGNYAAAAASSVNSIGNAETNAVTAKVAAEAARDTAVSAKNTAVQAAQEAQAASPGAVKVSNTDTLTDKLNNKLTVVAPLSKSVKNGGGNEQLELGIDLSAYATKGANNFTGIQTMPQININNTGTVSNLYQTLFNAVAQFGSYLTVKNNNTVASSTVDIQSAADTSGIQCGVRYANSTGNIKYQSYYTPSDGIYRHYATDGTGEWRWGIQGNTDAWTALSLKRVTSGLEKDYYALSVGDSANSTFGATLNLYGTTTNGRYAKIALCNNNTLRGGLIASETELNHYCTDKHTLMNLQGETFFEAWRDRASLIYSTARDNRIDWQSDGNMVLFRGGAAVWAISNYIASDVRLKTDIKPLEGSSLEKVKKLTAKTYLWKDDLMGKGDTREIGLIAQEVAEVVPEVVSKMSSGADTLGVAYTQLVPVLVEAVKELSAKVESLEAQLLSKE